MLIAGIPAEHLLRQHWNYGGGQGALAYLHVPSGISVFRKCPPNVPVVQVDQELLAELVEKLRAQGLTGNEQNMDR